MPKKHQYIASGKKTRTGQHRKTRHKQSQFLKILMQDTKKFKNTSSKKQKPPKTPTYFGGRLDRKI